jgi:hypothetical protein
MTSSVRSILLLLAVLSVIGCGVDASDTADAGLVADSGPDAWTGEVFIVAPPNPGDDDVEVAIADPDGNLQSWHDLRSGELSVQVAPGSSVTFRLARSLYTVSGLIPGDRIEVPFYPAVYDEPVGSTIVHLPPLPESATEWILHAGCASGYAGSGDSGDLPLSITASCIRNNEFTLFAEASRQEVKTVDGAERLINTPVAYTFAKDIAVGTASIDLPAWRQDWTSMPMYRVGNDPGGRFNVEFVRGNRRHHSQQSSFYEDGRIQIPTAFATGVEVILSERDVYSSQTGRLQVSGLTSSMSFFGPDVTGSPPSVPMFSPIEAVVIDSGVSAKRPTINWHHSVSPSARYDLVHIHIYTSVEWDIVAPPGAIESYTLPEVPDHWTPLLPSGQFGGVSVEMVETSVLDDYQDAKAKGWNRSSPEFWSSNVDTQASYFYLRSALMATYPLVY